MIINLQNYLNQEVQIELRNGEGYIGVVQEWRDSCQRARPAGTKADHDWPLEPGNTYA